MDFIVYLLTRAFIGLVWLIPFRLLYILSDGLAYFLCYVLKYRRKIVESNLKRSGIEIPRLVDVYKNLCDIVLESLKTPTLSDAGLSERYVMKGIEICNNYNKENISFVIAGAHMSNWEWAVLKFPMIYEGRTSGVYKPLNNKYLETYFSKVRSRTGMGLLAMKGSFEVMLKESRPSSFILVSDQNPSNVKRAHWVDFFGNDTACLHGMSELAFEKKIPILYFETMRDRRGYYTLTLSKLVDADTDLKPVEITQLFMKRVEKTILKQPANWLWTHKRWKHKRKNIV
jgi:KDO2-lipid IV(A) lauroyltransferase